MNTTKSKNLIAMLIFSSVVAVTTVYADETVTEKAQSTANDAERAVKKGTHRAEEAVCMQSDTKCLEEKAKHRAEEASDYTADKAKEAKNAISSDDKK